MIIYRPTLALTTTERRGFRAAVAAMAVAAVFGTTAFASVEAVAATTSAVQTTTGAVLIGTKVPAEHVMVRSQSIGSSLEQGAAAGSLETGALGPAERDFLRDTGPHTTSDTPSPRLA